MNNPNVHFVAYCMEYRSITTIRRPKLARYRIKLINNTNCTIYFGAFGGS